MTWYSRRTVGSKTCGGAGMNPHTELKVAVMTKRSQNRKFFTRDNYKHRIFVLTPYLLKYFELMGEARGKEKGRIRLNLIRVVEYVTDGELDNKSNVFQISFLEEIRGQPVDMSNRVVLYIVASNTDEREDWIKGIRMLSYECGARFQGLFHPGVWRKPGRYSCCDDINRRSNGCQRTTPFYIEPGGGGAGGPGVSLSSVMPNLLLPRGQTNGEAAVPGTVLPVTSVPSRPGVTAGGGGITVPASTASVVTSTTSPQKAGGTPTQGKRAASGQRRSSNRKISDTPAAPNLAPGVSEVEENTVIAVYNYNPVRENQLQLQKGEKYVVVNSDNPQWWYVRSLTGNVGYVPTNYIQKPNSLTTFDWYYRDITRQQAESILMEENREGCFLVRDSVTRKRTYTLSVTAKDPHKPGCMKVHHYHIHYSEEKGSYYLSEKHPFRTVHEVIHYHKHNSGGLVVRLRTPPTQDKECPVTAGMGLDMFELHPSELKLDKEVIGRGQFGVVLHGTYCGMHVAVKQMLPGAMNEDDFVEEAKNMKNLNHPNVVQLFGVVLRSRPIMIILEFMKHGSLRDYLRARQPSYSNRPTVLADACAQVANGMAYLEAAKFIHRDLAARNCLVKSVSRRCLQVKVGDFGMTRFLLDNVYEPSAGAKFPVRWAAPEVFQSTYTVKADVWSFGVLMWEVFTLCSENPYHGMNNTQVYQYIVGGGRLAKPAICPERLYILMLECWHYDPAKRPNFQYVSQKLEEYLDAHCDN